MCAEEFALVFDRLLDAQIVENVLHGATFNAIVAEFQRINAAIEQLQCICAFVHQVNFGEHANCALSLRVNFFGKLERVRVCQVRVGWRQS